MAKFPFPSGNRFGGRRRRMKRKDQITKIYIFRFEPTMIYRRGCVHCVRANSSFVDNSSNRFIIPQLNCLAYSGLCNTKWKKDYHVKTITIFVSYVIATNPNYTYNKNITKDRSLEMNVSRN